VAKPPEERERNTEEQDLFEDLDEFFAPLEDTGWPESEEGDAGAAVPPPEPAEGEPGALEDWDLAIDVPDEGDLVEEPAAAGTPGSAEVTAGEEARDQVDALEDEAEGASVAPDEERAALTESEKEPLEEEPAVEVIEADEEEGPLSVEDLEPAEDETGDLAAVPPEGAVPSEGEEAEEVLPEEVAVTAEDLFEDEPDQVPVSGAPSAEAPEPEAVEAAAEHFASGIRESPEDVERELLADLGEGAPEVEPVTITPPPPVTAPEEEAPTWQEAAEPVAEPEAPVAGRNLPAALASGILLALAVLALLLIGKAALAWFAGAVVLLGQAELYAVMRTRRLQPATLLGLVCGGLILAGAYAHGPAGAPFGLVLAMGLTVLWYMAAPAATRRSTTVHAGATLLGIAYVPFLASFALLLLAFPGNLGRNAFLVVVGLTVLYDVCAYAIGTLWGSRPLAPTISPHKSWEGAIGATFVLLLVALAVVPSIAPFDAPGRAVGLALVIALAAPLGDLVESALKRDMAVKDMGTLLPGHGGILDRIDAILFAAPAAYYFLQISF